MAKISINIPERTLKALEEMADAEGDKTASRAAYLLQKQVERELQPMDAITAEELDHIAQFLKLLVGDRESANGISLAVVAGLTGIDIAKLRRLYQTIQSLKEE